MGARSGGSGAVMVTASAGNLFGLGSVLGVISQRRHMHELEPLCT